MAGGRGKIGRTARRGSGNASGYFLISGDMASPLVPQERKFDKSDPHDRISRERRRFQDDVKLAHQLLERRVVEDRLGALRGQRLVQFDPTLAALVSRRFG